MGRLKKSGLKKGCAVVALFTLTLFAVKSPPVFSEEDHDRAKILRDTGQIRSLEEILEKATLEQRGTLIEVELEEEKGQIIYELEFLDTKGQVWEIKYDAESGEKISMEMEK